MPPSQALGCVSNPCNCPATFLVLRGLRVCQDPLQCEYSLACPYVALAQLIPGFLSMALCCSCRGGGELRSLLCLSPGPELPVFSSFTYTSGSGIAESSGNSMLTFRRNCQAVFHRVRTILPSRQQCTRVPISSPPGRCLSFSINFFFL